MGRTGRTVGQDRGFPARDGRAGQEAYIYRPLSRPSIRYLHHEKELRRFRPVRAVATGTMPGPAGVDPGLRPRASPLVSTPSRRLELQQTQYVPHRDPLAEQLEVYARLGGTSPPANREEEPVLEALESALLADRADSTVRRCHGRRTHPGSSAAEGVPKPRFSGRHGSPVWSIRQIMVAVRGVGRSSAYTEHAYYLSCREHSPAARAPSMPAAGSQKAEVVDRGGGREARQRRRQTGLITEQSPAVGSATSAYPPLIVRAPLTTRNVGPAHEFRVRSHQRYGQSWTFELCERCGYSFDGR